MAEIVKIKKGLDIPLKGKIEDPSPIKVETAKAGIVPDDFPGYTWKTLVKPGDNVVKGSPLLIEKENGKVAITSPITGTVKEVRRGERRKLEAIVVSREATKEGEKLPFEEMLQKYGDGTDADRELITDILCSSGLWAMMRQRPYDIVPNPAVTPRDIFITAFDSAPLAGQMISAAHTKYLESGIKVLRKLTEGKVYLGVAFGSGISAAGAEVVEFQGPHPAGNAGVQIAHIKPVNKGETVWAMDARTVVRMGILFTDHILDTDTRVAVTGPQVEKPRYVDTQIGASIEDILADFKRAKEEKSRIISGNVLTGIQVSREEGFLRYPYRQITVIREGDSTGEFMGWASMDPKKFSVKHSFPAFMRGLKKPFDFDARLKGGRRAMILSGEYDKVFPMDIYPEFLLKAIIANDIDKMEKLGIYEVAPEDFALPEFVDTSKIPLQQIVREGLTRLRKEIE